MLRPVAAPAPTKADGDLAARFARDGFVSPLTVMSEREAQGYRQQFEDAKRRFSDDQTFCQGLKRYPNLLMPFVDEITRSAAITNAIAAILGPDLLVLDAPFFIK